MEWYLRNPDNPPNLSQKETGPTESTLYFNVPLSLSLNTQLSGTEQPLEPLDDVRECNGLRLVELGTSLYSNFESSNFPSHFEESPSLLFTNRSTWTGNNEAPEDPPTITVREPSPEEGVAWGNYYRTVYERPLFEVYGSHDEHRYASVAPAELDTDSGNYAVPVSENLRWRSPQNEHIPVSPEHSLSGDFSGSDVSSSSVGHSPDAFSSPSLQAQSPLNMKFSSLILSQSHTHDLGPINVDFERRTHGRSVSLSPASPSIRGRSLSRTRGTHPYQHNTRSSSAHEQSAVTGFTPDTSDYYASDSQTLNSDGASSAGTSSPQPAAHRDNITTPATRKRAMEARKDPTKHARFKCNYKNCESTFTTKQNCDRHINAHYGINKFWCACAGSFTTASDRNRHMKTTRRKWEEQGEQPGMYRCAKVDEVKR